MTRIPQFAFPVFAIFSCCFTAPTLERFVALALAAIIAPGARTVSNLVRTLGPLLMGHATTYHHVFASRKWQSLRASRAFAAFLIGRFVPEGIIRLVGDDTVLSHPGRKVFGKARHRDAVRSSHSYTAFHYGHKWVVLALLIQLPCCRRSWALPILVALYKSPEWDREHGRRHRTPPEIMEDLLAIMLRWFPSRRFMFVGDGGFGTHRLARFAKKRQSQLTLVSRFYANGALYEAPPQRAGRKGRPSIKGKKLPYPKDSVTLAKDWMHLVVDWYGGQTREIKVFTDTGHWFKSGHGLVEIRWIYVKDLSGTHRDEYFFTTDLTLSAKQVVEAYTGRWNIETTFQELHAHLKVGSTRCRVEKSVLRENSSLFALYSVVVALYVALNPSGEKLFVVKWPGKKEVTFSDAIATVRQAIWDQWVFANAGNGGPLGKLSPQTRQTLLNLLANAA